jgi:mRNA interferase RelE/StbE
VYTVHIERSAERELDRVPADQFDRIASRIRALAANPRPPGCRKIVGSADDWRIRIGTWRVVYEIDDGAKAVRVTRVRRRPEAYR